jgi:hypothetical protein
MRNELTWWRISATRVDDDGGPPIEDEVQRATRPSAQEAARVLVQKSWMQGQPVPEGKPGATDIDRLLNYGFKITTIERVDDGGVPLTPIS